MTKTAFAAALCAALALSACSKEESPAAASEASAPAAACDTPALAGQVQTVIQQTIAANARRNATADESGFIDADKLIAFGAQLKITADNTKAGQMPATCQAQIHINIPETAAKQAQQYAPLLQNDAPKDIIARRVNGGSAQYQDNTLSFPLNYTLQNGRFAPTDNNLNGAANLLSEAFAAYGVKDTLVIGGKALSRDQALRLLKQKGKLEIEEASAPAPQEVPPIGDTVPNPPDPDTLKKAIPAPEPRQPADSDTPADTRSEGQPEKLTPPVPPQNRISDSELDEARRANREADQKIKSAWRNIDPEIQRDLMDEQRGWENKKQQSCRAAAAKGADKADSQYLQLQCDTRMTRERVQYLKGYSINE